MMSFRKFDFKTLNLPASTVWFLTEIAEAKGRQGLYTQQSPQLLTRLLETALIQSVESSNRIEGVTVAVDRLEPLVIGNSKPRDRAEHEIHGYRQALNRIHTISKQLPISIETLCLLHHDCQEGSGDAGQLKQVENDIVELVTGQAPKLRFKTTVASETQKAMQELCSSYSRVINQQEAHPLVMTACLILDFLCIHPFRDGNGRVARLAALLSLYHHGFEVARYISLERLIEESKDEYYQSLFDSSQNWHEGKHDILPWLNYFLSILRRAYRLFETRVSTFKNSRGMKTTSLESALKSLVGEFTLRQLQECCPAVGYELVRTVLKAWQKEGRIKSLGRGPGARWKVIT